MAILICLDKIERSGAKTLKDAGGNIIPPIAGIELSESMYDSEVSCSIEAMLFNNRALDANPGGLFNAAEWVGENLFAGSVELIYNAMSSEEDNASIVQDSLQIANKTSKSPSINKKQVATQLSAFGTTPVGSTPPGTGFVNKTELSGTPFEQMVFAKFFTPCSASEGQGVARLRSIDLVNGTALQTGVSEVQSGFRSSGSSTNTPSVENISQTPSGPATGSALGSIQPIINTPRQVGPERPRTDLNSARAFAAIGSGLDRFLQQDGAIAQAVTIIDKGKEQTQVDDNEVPGLYTRYAMSIVEQNGDSRVVSRSTQTDGETLAIKFGQPTKGLILVWSATKAGFPPEIPTLSDSDQFTYIRSTIDFKNMEIMADNKTPMFTMSGSIWYEYTGSKDYSTSCPPPPWVNIGNNQFLSVVSSKTTALTIADS